MVGYLLRRLAYMLLMLVVVTLVAFMAIWLQPGDCFTKNQLLGPEAAEVARKQLGLDRHFFVQYWFWIRSIFEGSFGLSCQGQPVTQVLFAGRWSWSLLLAGAALLASWGIGLPFGVYAAVHQGSWRDYGVRLASVLGIALPAFLLALLTFWLLYLVGAKQLGWEMGQVMASQYQGAPWSWAKMLSVLLHLGPPVLVVAATQWAVLARHLRGHLLDVLSQPYIQAARAKGLSERRLVYKHALRNALHPLVSLMGFWLPSLFEGTLAVAIVMSLPIVELALWDAIQGQDQYVVLSGLFFVGILLVLGNFLSDLALAWVDPRIRYE